MEYDIAENIGTALIPTQVQPEQIDAEIEQQLTTDINALWNFHVQAQNTVATTKEELKVIRHKLGERLHEMKRLLARPGRNGEWSPFLKEHKIPRTTADRLVAAHERLLAPETNCTAGAIDKPTVQDIQRLFTSIRPRLAKILTTQESVYAFILCLINRASLPYERRDEGILLFHPRVSAPEEPKFVAPENVSPAETANSHQGHVV